MDRSELSRDARAVLMPGFEGFEAPAWIADAFAAGMLSVCVYGANVRDRAQLIALGRELRALAPAALIAIDEEGGEVTRLDYLEGSPYPGAAVMGRIDDPAYTSEIGRRVAAEILDAGFNLALAPDADVNSDPLNPVIGTRSFGADPTLVSRHVAAWTSGLVAGGAVACAKHFPGHGDTSQDSHLALPVVAARREVIIERDLPPFRAAFDAGSQTVMTSHIMLPALDADNPATFSSSILQGLLRDELGFTGVIVSDALDMRGASGEIGIPEAAVRALAAGCDLLCTGVGTGPDGLTAIVDGVIDAVETGRLARERLAEAAARVRSLSEAVPASAVALSAERPDAVSPLRRTAPDPEELARIAASFAGAEAARAWIAEHPDASVLRLDSIANMAVGFAPWGPFAATDHPFAENDAAVAAFEARWQIAIDSDSEISWPLAELSRTGVIAIGRDVSRHAFARKAVDELRAAGVPILVVEMGWPGPETDYSDLATYGSSALVGAALLALLAEGAA